MLDRSKGSHHIFIHPVLKRRVVVPFHKKDLPNLETDLVDIQIFGSFKKKMIEILKNIKFIPK